MPGSRDVLVRVKRCARPERDMFDDNKSELQREILQVYDRNPDADPPQIADICDCSESYVRQTLNEYRDDGLADFGLGI